MAVPGSPVTVPVTSTTDVLASALSSVLVGQAVSIDIGTSEVLVGTVLRSSTNDRLRVYMLSDGKVRLFDPRRIKGIQVLED